MKKLLFFGCLKKGEAGHFLYENERNEVRHGLERNLKLDANVEVLKIIDGTFTPQKYESGYNDCVVPPFRIVAWWDQSGDSRPGSNSNLIGIGYTSAEDMIDDAIKKYPLVMNRQPRPIKHEKQCQD